DGATPVCILQLDLALRDQQRLLSIKEPAPPEIYTLSLHDALPISTRDVGALERVVRRSVEIKAEVVAADEREAGRRAILNSTERSEEHTSELQSRSDLVCRLLLEKKKDERQSCRDPRLAAQSTGRG